MTKSEHHHSQHLIAIRFLKPVGGNYKLATILALTVLFDLCLIFYRNLHLTNFWQGARQFSDLLTNEHGTGFLFLVWNLFLAWIPYGLSLLIRQDQTAGLKYILLFWWLLFFPNAPYIITDLIHLHHRPPVPMWYDMLTIFAFAWTGLIFGYLSLIRVQKVLIGTWGATVGKVLVGGILLLAGIGIYIGRFLRWNTWDIVVQPRGLSADLLSMLIHPSVHWPAMGSAILLSVMLALGYFTLQAIRP